MKEFTFLLVILFLSAAGCCGCHSYILSISSQPLPVVSRSVLVPGPFNFNASSSGSATSSGPSSGNSSAGGSGGQGNPPPQGQMTTIVVTFYTDVGLMADGHPTHPGACAAYQPQFPFGTKLNVYRPNNLNQPAYTCTVEDTGTRICQDDLDVWIASVAEALNLGRPTMKVQVVGFDKAIAQDAANNHPASQGCEAGKNH